MVIGLLDIFKLKKKYSHVIEVLYFGLREISYIAVKPFKENGSTHKSPVFFLLKIIQPFGNFWVLFRLNPAFIFILKRKCRYVIYNNLRNMFVFIPLSPHKYKSNRDFLVAVSTLFLRLAVAQSHSIDCVRFPVHGSNKCV